MPVHEGNGLGVGLLKKPIAGTGHINENTSISLRTVKASVLSDCRSLRVQSALVSRHPNLPSAASYSAPVIDGPDDRLQLSDFGIHESVATLRAALAWDFLPP